MNQELYRAIGEKILTVMGGEELPSMAIDVELEQEYPQAYRTFVNDYTGLYELHGCGHFRGHINAIAAALSDLEARGLAQKTCRPGGEIYWRAVRP